MIRVQGANSEIANYLHPIRSRWPSFTLCALRLYDDFVWEIGCYWQTVDVLEPNLLIKNYVVKEE